MIEQWAGKFQTDQMVAFGMGQTHSARPQGPCSLWKIIIRGYEGSAGYFEQNLRGGWKRAAHGHEHSSSGNVERRRKFKKFLAFFVTAANKNRDREWQARPPSAFYYGFCVTQAVPSQAS